MSPLTEKDKLNRVILMIVGEYCYDLDEYTWKLLTDLDVVGMIHLPAYKGMLVELKKTRKGLKADIRLLL